MEITGEKDYRTPNSLLWFTAEELIDPPELSPPNFNSQEYLHDRLLIERHLESHCVPPRKAPIVHCHYFSKLFGIDFDELVANLALDANLFGKQIACFRYRLHSANRLRFLTKTGNKHPINAFWDSSSRTVRRANSAIPIAARIHRELLDLPGSGFHRGFAYAQRVNRHVTPRKRFPFELLQEHEARELLRRTLLPGASLAVLRREYDALVLS